MMNDEAHDAHGAAVALVRSLGDLVRSAQDAVDHEEWEAALDAVEQTRALIDESGGALERFAAAHGVRDDGDAVGDLQRAAVLRALQRLESERAGLVRRFAHRRNEISGAMGHLSRADRAAEAYRGVAELQSVDRRR